MASNCGFMGHGLERIWDEARCVLNEIMPPDLPGGNNEQRPPSGSLLTRLVFEPGIFRIEV